MDMTAVAHHWRNASITATERANRPAKAAPPAELAAQCRRVARLAADEIERLAADNSALRAQLRPLAERCDRLRDELAAARAQADALRERREY